MLQTTRSQCYQVLAYLGYKWEHRVFIFHRYMAKHTSTKRKKFLADLKDGKIKIEGLDG